MKRIVRLTEKDLTRIVKRIINEQEDNCNKCLMSTAKKLGLSNDEATIQKLQTIYTQGKEPSPASYKMIFGMNDEQLRNIRNYNNQFFQCKQMCSAKTM